ncbi:lysophospholipase [Christiangramia fulva]|uniref:Lysophospholipase n=1 Tax=Christiangramia fulva TaxID=2126553 RepID=A0A2R3Z697_9FLAO|nr:SGNH/GDSL hydrolase family protein [Christiangramia fulva]AVR45734.1 lysophospholipase [Christiangramia fulva]
MKKFYVFLLIFISISCGSRDPKILASVENPQYSYLALGDSYTIGESVAEAERWPLQLAEALRNRGYKMAVPKIIAKTGWTTENLINGMEKELAVQRDFDLVSILIGVNNQYQGKPIHEYEQELRKIFRKAINHSKTMEKGVFALSIPDYGYTPFGIAHQDEISKEIDRYNEVYKRVADDFGVDFYDITPISREVIKDPRLVARDSLHPSKIMYRRWVDQIVNQVAQKLSK